MTKIRAVTDEDRKNLETFSYSRIDTFKQCPMKYQFHYVDNLISDEKTLALSLGTLLHFILETKGKMIIENEEADYNKLEDILENGTDDIPGVKQLSKQYFDQWYEKNEKSGLTYKDKIENFKIVMRNEMEDDNQWIPYKFEHEFEYVYDDRVILHGFIDRIDINSDGDYRTIDYKTNNKPYDDKSLPTALQFVIYALAIYNEFGRLPIESLYRLILLDKQQKALSIGWENRAQKALDKIFNALDECKESKIYAPKPAPLCAWCDYSNTNKTAIKYKDECQYYSLWTPENKTFEKNKEFNPNDTLNDTLNNTKRKLVF